MLGEIIASQGSDQWIVLGRDPDKKASVIDTNEYLVISDGEAILLDPGGTEVFPAVLTAVSEFVKLSQIKAFFCSHQDPDIFSSLPLWLGVCPQADIYLPRIWSGFVAHFGYEYVDRFKPIPDEGGQMALGRPGRSLDLIPAHYCHSSGNFSVYDPLLQVLFTGDIGAALLPAGSTELFVDHFAEHVGYMEGFHRRWMPSNEAKNDWISRLRPLGARLLCPQHGSLFRGEQVTQFLDWFERLEVGSAVHASRPLAKA